MVGPGCSNLCHPPATKQSSTQASSTVQATAPANDLPFILSWLDRQINQPSGGPPDTSTPFSMPSCPRTLANSLNCTCVLQRRCLPLSARVRLLRPERQIALPRVSRPTYLGPISTWTQSCSCRCDPDPTLTSSRALVFASSTQPDNLASPTPT